MTTTSQPQLTLVSPLDSRDTQRQMKDSDSHLNNLTTQLEDLQNHHNTLQKELKSANQSLVEAREEGSRLHDLERQARSSLDQAKERQVCVYVCG